MNANAMRLPDPLVWRVAMIAAVLAAVSGVLFTAGAHAKPACTVTGPRWTHYDAHGGANPKMDATGRLYYVGLMGYSCAGAKTALKRIFPLFPRPPYKPGVSLRGGPSGSSADQVAGARLIGGSAVSVRTRTRLNISSSFGCRTTLERPV